MIMILGSGGCVSDVASRGQIPFLVLLWLVDACCDVVGWSEGASTYEVFNRLVALRNPRLSFGIVNRVCEVGHTRTSPA